jgi:hypothetical protein
MKRKIYGQQHGRCPRLGGKGKLSSALWPGAKGVAASVEPFCIKLRVLQLGGLLSLRHGLLKESHAHFQKAAHPKPWNLPHCSLTPGASP